MSRKLIVLSCLALGAAYLGAIPSGAAQRAQGRPAPDQATHLQRGLASFEQGLYEYLPKNRRAEAAAAFALAIRELDLVVQAEPNSREAHRALARLHALRQDHLEAAAHYRRLTEIDPFDIDAYALGALELAEAGRFSESRVELEKAKGRTAEPRTLALLDEYLAKLTEAEKRSGDGR